MSRLLFSAALVSALLLTGCATAPSRPAVAFTGDPITDGLALREAGPPQDRALWDFRVAATALRTGQPDLAAARLDEGLGLAAAATGGPSAAAASSRRMFRRESDKPFVGEPYERVMASFYRGLLYWMNGEPDNARALFRNGQFIDSDATDRTYAGDWVLLEYLDGLITRRLGGDGKDAKQRAEAAAKRALPEYDPQANVFIVAEYGRGPRKIAGGQAGELLRFQTLPSTIASARLRIGERTWEMPPYDDLNYQATTRGGRVMDHVLGNKAVFKENASNVGDVALMGALATHELGRGEDKDQAALALVAIGILSKMASSATQASADTRTWDNLPQYLSFAHLSLPPGEHAAELEFLDSSGQVVTEKTQRFAVNVPERQLTIGGPDRPIVVALKSELPK